MWVQTKFGNQFICLSKFLMSKNRSYVNIELNHSVNVSPICPLLTPPRHCSISVCVAMNKTELGVRSTTERKLKYRHGQSPIHLTLPGGGAGKWQLGHFECRCCLLPHQNNGLDLPFNQQTHYPCAHYLRHLQLSLSLLFSTSRREGWDYIECILYMLMIGIPKLPVKWNLILKVFI